MTPSKIAGIANILLASGFVLAWSAAAPPSLLKKPPRSCGRSLTVRLSSPQAAPPWRQALAGTVRDRPEREGVYLQTLNFCKTNRNQGVRLCFVPHPFL